jgi:outer membrane receptor protein involved in Fe transport
MTGFKSALFGGSAAAITLLAFAAPAAAAADSSTNVGEVVVTGSRIPRTDTTTAAPVTVLSAGDITDYGYTQVGQLLNEVTSNVPSFPTPPFTGVPVENAGRQAPNLFDLGVGRTLTLMNGRRMVTTSSGLDDSAVDTNIIPVGLISRVDVVQAGGSAIYGSDAIAGVVNYVLKQNFQGVVLDAQYGSSTRGDDRNPSLRATFGTNFDNDRGNIAADIEWSKTSALLNSDRPWSAADYNSINNPAFTGQPNVPSQIEGSNTRYWDLNTNGEIFVQPRPGPQFLLSPTGVKVGSNNGVGLQFAPGGQSLIPLNTGIVSGGIAVGGDGEDPATTSSLTAGVERYTASVIGHYDLTPHIKLSGEFTYGHTVATDPFSTQSIAMFAGGNANDGQAGIPFTSSNPYLTPAEVSQLEALSMNQQTTTFTPKKNTPYETTATYTPIGGVQNATFANGGPLYLSAFLNDLPTREEVTTTDTARALLDLSGDFHELNRDFNWDVSYSHALSQGRNLQYAPYTAHLYNALNAVKNSSGQIVCAINAVTVTDAACQPLDPFGNMRASTAVQNYVSAPIGDHYFNIQDDFLATFGGEVITLPGGKVKFNAAYEHRSESVNFKPSFAEQNGLIYGGEISTPERDNYSTNELSGELVIPVFGGDFTLPFVKALELDGSYRYVDNTIAGKENVWSIGGKWEIAYGFSLRGSRSRNFRAPTLNDLISPQFTSDSFLGFDPCNANVVGTGPHGAATLANCTALFAQHQGPGGWGLLSNFMDPAVNTSITAITTGGNPNLKNEISDTTTYGIVYQPTYIPGLSITVDRVDVDLANALTDVTAAAFVSNCYDQTPMDTASCATFTRDPSTGWVTAAHEEIFNAARVRWSGEIYAVDYRFPIERYFPVKDWGTVELGLQATHTAVASSQLEGSAVNRTDGTVQDPTWRVRFDLHYSRGPLRLFYSMYYLPQARAQEGATIFSTPVPVIAANVQHTISAQYDFRNITFRAGINNLTDQGPSYGTLNYGDIIGRTFFVGASAKF